MRYYKQYNPANRLVMIGINCGGTEITKEEYGILLAQIQSKAELVEKLYSGEITIEDVPTKWQEEIERRVAERIELETTLEQEEVSSEEFYEMVKEVL